MTTLWRLEEGTVREIRDALAVRRPRAYTTIMTIMDRLARKQIVARHRVGRAWTYQANLSRQQARSHAIEQVVESFFGGSATDLLEQVSGIVSSAGQVPHTEADAPGNDVNLPIHAGEPPR